MFFGKTGKSNTKEQPHTFLKSGNNPPPPPSGRLRPGSEDPSPQKGYQPLFIRYEPDKKEKANVNAFRANEKAREEEVIENAKNPLPSTSETYTPPKDTSNLHEELKAS
uniref:Uncharacterized protein n=1 Tax=Tupiella akineta TaxID=160070 RepID=Q3ZJ51_TUPAK|nr:hypothetical protein PsakCp042 [Tupiella akineta]AAV80640.1 hypothetical protein [Tupiella akineta]